MGIGRPGTSTPPCRTGSTPPTWTAWSTCTNRRGDDGTRGRRGWTDLDAIHNWAALLEMGGRNMALTTVYCIEQGDLALLRNDYTVDFGGQPVSGSTTEVVRRQPDGTWLYVIDNPFGAMPTT